MLQNYFEGVARAILILDQTKMSNVDLPHRPIGFYYCAIAMRQRVLQHIRRQSGHRNWRAECPLSNRRDRTNEDGDALLGRVNTLLRTQLVETLEDHTDILRLFRIWIHVLKPTQ